MQKWVEIALALELNRAYCMKHEAKSDEERQKAVKLIAKYEKQLGIERKKENDVCNCL